MTMNIDGTILYYFVINYLKYIYLKLYCGHSGDFYWITYRFISWLKLCTTIGILNASSVTDRIARIVFIIASSSRKRRFLNSTKNVQALSIATNVWWRNLSNSNFSSGDTRSGLGSVNILLDAAKHGQWSYLICETSFPFSRARIAVISCILWTSNVCRLRKFILYTYVNS